MNDDTMASNGKKRGTRRPRLNGARGTRGRHALHALLEALQAAEAGDFSVRLPVPPRDAVLGEIARAFNTLMARSGAFTDEMVRVERVVVREGRMSERMSLGEVGGAWATRVRSLNALIGDLVLPTTEVARVLAAVVEGDLTQKMALEIDGQPVRGEFLRIGTTANAMVDQLRAFAAEVTRVAKEVGTEGKLGGQADVKGAAGTWKDLTDNVNFMASNLTTQVRGIARVVTAVANGDLSQRLKVEAKGEVAELSDTINAMTETLSIFAQQVTDVARTVGVEGKLGSQAVVPGVAGTWKDLTNNVNLLANNLTDQVRNIAEVTTAVARGDLSRKITVDARGEVLQLKDTINTMVDQLRAFASEVTRVAKEVGTEGKLGGQAEVKGVSGVWKDLTENVNVLAGNLTTQVRNIAKVTTAVANGDLSQKISVEVRGEILELKNTINTMVDQLNAFASEVTRVAKEVGVEGKLGGQAVVPGVAGTWKNLTDNVNLMASNLTDQVRNIALVTTAVANGDLSKKITVDVKGEILELKNTINTMVDQLNSFASEVTRVAREVGVEGMLGGQARVPGARGTWRQLTDNVNQLAATLTSQLRAISDVATAVTKGDLTRSITVGAEGEVAALKDNINQMIFNLRETTQKNQEQDWLKTNLAKFSGMMQGQKNLEAVSRLIMSELTPLVGAHHGAFFLMDPDDKVPTLKLTSTYAYRERKTLSNRFRLGEGLVGQCALEKKTILLTQVPPDYITISSGLGEHAPLNIIVLPVLFEGAVKAVIELASFHAFSAIHQIFLDQLTESIGVVLNMIIANMRTEELLLQSQSLTQELQSQSNELTQQQEELKRTNAELEKQALELEVKARQLEEQNNRVEEKNREVELARVSLEDKAAQLSLISKYKSEFLANMSHELRTPLNSLLILARLLADNKEGNLTPKQVEYAHTIHASGGELLTLINEILDLSKVEAGKMQVEPRDVLLSELGQFVERAFHPVAEQKGLAFSVELDPSAPRSLRTDPQRLQQILKNLLSNAFKFTDEGRVTLEVRMAEPGRGFEHEALREARDVIAFAVKDTGIGIPEDKQRLIFEAFQQADGSTARKYGGTGLGLSISREIARLLGGEIHVESQPGQGSTFTLYMPPEFGGSEKEAAPLADLGPSMEDDRQHLREGEHTLLIIEDDPTFARIMMQMAREKGFQVLVASGGDTGLSMAHEYLPHAITLDIQLPGVDGWSVLERLKRNPRTRDIPVHIISVMDKNHGNTQGAFGYLTKPATQEGLEQALSQMARFLEGKERRAVAQRADAEGSLADKKILVVDDDMRNIFAITSVLENEGMRVRFAENGRAAIEALREDPDVDVVLMDIMMPEMDGYETMRSIRQELRLASLPIIAVTAKALKDDREKCMAAGANDYLPKPVDTDKLIELVQQWVNA